MRNCNFVIPRTSKLQQKPSPLKKEHPALRNMFLWVFFALWIRIQPTKINADPDPKRWIF